MSKDLKDEYRTGLPPVITKVEAQMDGKVIINFNKPMRFSDKVVSHLDISNNKGRRMEIKEPHDHHHRLITITYEAEEGEDSIERRDENKTLEDDYMW